MVPLQKRKANIKGASKPFILNMSGKLHGLDSIGSIYRYVLRTLTPSAKNNTGPKEEGII